MSLLSSKIRAPSLPPHAIERPRLRDRLLEPALKLAVLQAPAGYGKTVLAAQIHAAEPRRTAWLYLEPEDADPRRFCRYFAGSLRRVLPALAGTELMESPDTGDFDPNRWVEDLILFFQEFGSSRLRLVLDNFEAVSGEPVLTRVIERLLRHAGHALGFLITTRSDPGLSLHRLAERKEALKLIGRDLAFNLDEFKHAARAQGKAMLPADLESMWARSEGWCVYLGLGTGPGGDHSPLPPDATGIAGYLDEEIVGGLPEGERHLLLAASVLDVVSAEGLEALGLGGRAFRERVAELRRLGIPHLDVMGGEGVRIHPLVRERLLEEFRRSPASPAKRRVLEGAAAFYRSRGRCDTAVRTLLDAEAYEPALETLDAGWMELEEQQLLPLVSGWLEKVPPEYRSHPLFVLARARVLRFQGENLQLVEYLDRLRADGIPAGDSPVHPRLWILGAWARTHLGSASYDELRAGWETLRDRFDPADRLAAEFTLIVAALYDLRFEAAEEHTARALGLVPPDSVTHRARMLNARGVVLQEMGRSREALELFDAAILECRRHRETAHQTLNLLGKAFLLKDVGRFREALEVTRECLDVARDSGSTRLVLMAHAARTRGEVYWYTGRWTEAFAELEESYRLFQDSNRYEALATGVLIDHWRSIQGKRSHLVTDGDFEGRLAVSEARVRYLIRRGRAEAAAGNTGTAVRFTREAREMAREMPAWQATAHFTEAWARNTAGDSAGCGAALAAGLGVLERLERPTYPLADPELTGWLAAEAVARGILVDRALSLVSGEAPVDLQPAWSHALRSAERPEEDQERLVEAAIRLSIRGLDDAVAAARVPRRSKTAYANAVAGAPLPPLRVRLLGPFEILGMGREIRFPRSASRRILQILLLEHPRPVHEERLLDLIWPDTDPRKAKRSLQTSVNDLRGSLDPHHRPRRESYIGYEDEHYRLSLPAASFVDLHAFRDEVSELLDSARTGPLPAERLSRALDLYGGDLLAEAPYEEFAIEPRERARSLMLEGTGALARALIEARDARATRVLRHGLEVDPLWAEGVALLMAHLRDQGRMLAAVRLYRDYERRLDQELGVEPDLPLRRVFEGLTHPSGTGT